MKLKSYCKYIIMLALSSALAACDRGDIDFVAFKWLDEADETSFNVYARKVTDLADGIPADCHIPEDDADTKTTSTTINALIADLFEYDNKGEVLELSGKYRSFDIHTGEEVTLSGKVLLPKDRKPKRYIIVNHYTIGSNAEAPSNSFPLEGVLCNLGYAMIFPDYAGYGVDCARVHPYLILEQTAFDVYAMYVAVKQYLEKTDYAPEHDDIYIMGFSQGGAVTMAVQWMMEEFLFSGDEIRHVFAGGGPYDVRETYNTFITSNVTNIPPAVPYVIQGMIRGNHLDIDMKELLQPWIYEKMDEWINSKKYSTDQLRKMMGTTKTSDILTDVGMDPTSDAVAELYKAMSMNSILSYNWTPKAPVYMLHSMEDDVVPFVNASKAKAKWADANIQYNFGYYGSHKMTTLRFIYSVKKWLKEEGE
ncbi:MAG: alpha/beta hydrolase family protein [Candidatus Cryptobacteroides sp.]